MMSHEALTAFTPDRAVELAEREFEGRTILVVGGSKGIGAEVALLAASSGASKVIINSREQSRNEALSLIQQMGEIGRYVPGDITISETAARIVEDASGDGRLDDVIISAGTRDDGLFMTMTDEQLRRIMETNFLGPAFIAREAVLKMRRQRPRGGTITFISSLAAEGNPGQANYSASKGAINSLVKTLAKEYAGSGIRVNAIAPGLVDTALTSSLTNIQRTSLLEATESQRALTPDEVARGILYIASPKRDSSLTGSIIPIVG